MFKCINTKTKNTRGIVLQRGSALIIALVFLLLMTLIGTTAMQGTSQQEKMAGNMRDRNLAFQAAEAALRTAERDIEDGLPIAGLITAPNPPRTDGEWINTYNWGAAPNQLPANTLANLAPNQQPRFVIENTNNQDVKCLSNLTLNCYRITARGVGGTTDTVVILQSTFYRS